MSALTVCVHESERKKTRHSTYRLEEIRQQLNVIQMKAYRNRDPPRKAKQQIAGKYRNNDQKAKSRVTPRRKSIRQFEETSQYLNYIKKKHRNRRSNLPVCIQNQEATSLSKLLWRNSASSCRGFSFLSRWRLYNSKHLKIMSNLILHYKTYVTSTVDVALLQTTRWDWKPWVVCKKRRYF